MTLTLALKATLILGAVAVATAFLRRGSAAQRHLIWTVGLAALLALPWLPVLSLRPRLGPLAAMFTAERGSVAATGLPMPWVQWLWLAGVAAVLLRLAVAHLRMARSSDVPMAMTWGILRPRILSPAGGLHRFDRQHEEAHIARRDGLWQLVAQLTCALYWFHPLVWWAERRAAQERERACDDLVLASGVNPADYAQRLVEAARALAAPPVAALAVSGESGLAGRVEAILDPAVNRRGLRPRDLAFGLALAALVLLPLAPIVAQNSAAPDSDTKAQLIHKIEPEYSVEARSAEIEGPVHLTAVVRTDGSFADVKVETGLGYGLDEKAIEAVEQWHGRPATKDGEPVDSDVRITVNFRLE
jgi:TonB family protein